MIEPVKKDLKGHKAQTAKSEIHVNTMQDLERSEERLATATQKLAEASHAADESER